VADDPERLAAFARAWRAATPQFRAYKRLDLYDPLVEAFLRAAGV
jgi:dimethylamine monooxygenase subunit A